MVGGNSGVSFNVVECVMILFVLGCRVVCFLRWFFFFQAEDGIRDAQESRGLGYVYKRQV